MATGERRSHSVPRKPKPKLPPPPPPPVIVGVAGPGIALPNKSCFRPTADIAFELDNAVALGARWIREDVGWATNAWYDYHVAQIQARGLGIYCTLGSSGVSAFGLAGAKYNATNIITLVNNLVPHYYAMGITEFEILNEPNLNGYSAAEYLAIVQAAYPRIKALAPTARVWVGAIGIGGSARDQFNNFVKPLFPAVVSSCDGFSIHASDMPNPVGERWWSMQAWTWGPVGGDITDTIRALLDRNGGAGKPIILSEYNMPFNKPDELTQATRVVDNVKDARYVGVANYTIMDDDVAGFGMLRLDRSKRLVWDAYRTATIV